MKGIQVRKGAILLWRLGTIEYGAQDRWSRAPKSRGMWAFPWPYYDTFFTYHQYLDRLPKHLQTRADIDRSEQVARWSPAFPSGYVLPDGSTPTSISFTEDGEIVGEAEVRDSFWEERDEWVRDVGMKILPLRKFWYEGDLYSHISRTGEIGNAGTIPVPGFDSTDWYHIHSSELATAIRRSRGDSLIERNPAGGLSRWRTSKDHLEVFLAPGDGKISSPRPSDR